ncbi:MAG: class I tRNA ligase family protein [bacterium]
MPLPQNYNAKDFEDKIYQEWIDAGVGNPEKQFENNTENYLVLDCDGVLADSWEPEIQARIESGLASNRQEAVEFQTQRHAKSPFKKAGQNDQLLLNKTSNWHDIKFNYFLKTDSYKPFESFINELKKLKNTKLAVISSNADKIVTPFCQSLGLNFTHILTFKDSPSKQEKLEKITKDWGVNLNQIKFITDTKSDVIELKGILPETNLFGVSWGFHGGKSLQEIQQFTPEFKGLDEVLLQAQILNTPGELSKVFSKSGGYSKTHSILMPPPNLSGNMHAGHSFQHFLMDTLSRLARQRGELDLWYPGVDHAGIQLEGVIDKLIKKGEFDQQINEYTKSPLLRGGTAGDGVELELPQNRSEWPQFIKKNHNDLWLTLAWEKVNLWRNNQQNQAKVLGDTPDYSRQLFTLDDRANDMVYYAFKRYYEDGLIYKGAYLVNWSVGLQTALSDVSGEIEFETRTDPFVTFEYEAKELKIDNEELKIKFGPLIENYLKPVTLWPRLRLSTVRPETKFTDLAVAMHPTKFETYFNLDIFETAKDGFDGNLAAEFFQNIQNYNIEVLYHLPALKSGDLKLIFSEKIDPNFGTGVLKVTPAHDQFDYDLYKEFVEKGVLESGKIQTSINRDGKLAEVCGKYAGLTVEQGRLAVIKRLAETGYIPVKDKYSSDANSPSTEGVGGCSDEQILNEVKNNLESEHFDPTELSYEEGQKRLQELLGEAGSKLQINWNYEHNVSLCERSKTVIEPLISEEFFLSYDKEFLSNPPLQRGSGGVQGSTKDSEARSSTESSTTLQKLGLEGISETTFFSEQYKQMAINFVENIKDWCISRDLTWGHKFPVWYNLDLNPEKRFFSFKELTAPPLQRGLGGVPSKNNLVQVQTYSYPKNNIFLKKHFLNWKDIPFNTKLTDFAKQNRNKQTKIEAAFWDFTKTKKFMNLDFDRQKIIGNFIVDFYQKDIGLVIELDGEEHLDKKDVDLMRDKYLQSLGLKVYRVTNQNIFNHFQDVLNDLEKFIIDNFAEHPPTPSVEGEPSKTKYSALPLKIQPNKPTEPGNWVQEEKILDTWFSSCLWPLSTLDFVKTRTSNITTAIQSETIPPLQRESGSVPRNETGEVTVTNFNRFYPTQEMTTAKEIFYLWIVRMIILGKYFTGTIPFETVIITPTILDDKGRKMSKSLDNGLDPVEAIEKFSSDSLRLAMLGGMIPNRNMKMGGALADNQMEKYRNFGNKIWNVARFLDL